MAKPTEAAERFARALQKKFHDKHVEKYGDKAEQYSFANRVYGVDAGQKFDKITVQDGPGTHYPSGKSVYAFVERATGDVIKAAGWKAPAKLKTGWAVGGNVASPAKFAEALAKADEFGGWLYQR